MFRFWPCSCLSKINLRERDIELLFGGKMKLEQIRNKNNDVLIKRLMISLTKYAKFTCEIDGQEHCIDKDCITLDCDHKFCKECITENLEFELDRGHFEIVCPGDKCDRKINHYIMKYVLGKEKEALFEKYLMFKIDELSLNPGDKLGRCPNSNCNYKVIYATNIENIFHVCQICKKKFCLNGCHQVHEGKTCQQFDLEDKERKDNKDFLKFKKEEKIMDCPNPECRLIIVKREGCDHITCPQCKYEFCYVCGEDWDESHYEH